MSDNRGGRQPKEPVRKKRVQPYPFPGELETNGVKKQVHVAHVTPLGFLARLGPGVMVFVGEYYHVVMELPNHTYVNTEARVVKTYDRSLDPRAIKVERMAEFHFETLSEDHRKNILSFMAVIGQK